MVQEFLDGSNVVAFFEKMGCKAVSEGVNRYPFGKPRLFGSGLDRLLKSVNVNVIPAYNKHAWINGEVPLEGKTQYQIHSLLASGSSVKGLPAGTLHQLRRIYPFHISP